MKIARRSILTLLAVFCFSVLVNAQTPVMISDIRTGNLGSTPGNLIVLNDTLYFRAHNGTNGFELWKFDGVNLPSMVMDIKPGSASGAPVFLTKFNNKIYFRADDGVSGPELWVYDGINPPSMVADINPGAAGAFVEELAVFNNKLYFKADDGVNGFELWEYDGVNAPSMVANINTLGDANPKFLTEFNNKLFFQAKGDTAGTEMWAYDGVNAPALEFQIIPDTLNSLYGELTVFNGKLYFQSDDLMGNGVELWEYDGVNPPSLFLDINPGAASSNPQEFTLFNNKMFFRATTASNGEELWVYDGVNPPSMAADIRAGNLSSSPIYFAVFDNKLYFKATDGTHGAEIWSYDDVNPPVMVYDIRPGTPTSSPAVLTPMNDNLYFRASDGALGAELWTFCKSAETSNITEMACQSYTSPSGKYVWTTSGTYVDTVVGGTSMWCDSIITINLTVDTVDTAVVVTGHTLTSNATGANYQWLNCSSNFGQILGEMNQSFTPLVDGDYAVEVTQNGCVDTSECVSVVGVGIVENTKITEVKIFPNLVSDVLQVQIDAQSNKTYSIRIINTLGEVRKEMTSIKQSVELDLTSLTSGLYFIDVADQTTSQVFRIVKQ